jgi:hypothetical protein
MTETATMYTVTGEAIEVLPVGTSVRHRRFVELTGTIVKHEFHGSGAISPIPYFVEWNDKRLARKALGILFCYVGNGAIEEITNG